MKNLADGSVQKSILDRIAKVRPGSKPLWGRMSAHQMLCHLSDSFRSSMGEKKVSSATGLLQRTLVKYFALYVPLPWPKNLPTMPEVEQGVGGTPPTQFERDRAILRVVIERFCSQNGDFEWSPHPLFGQLRERERMRWGYLHTDPHPRQFGA